jgi:hypothetical protein
MPARSHVRNSVVLTASAIMLVACSGSPAADPFATPPKVPSTAGSGTVSAAPTDSAASAPTNSATSAAVPEPSLPPATMSIPELEAALARDIRSGRYSATMATHTVVENNESAAIKETGRVNLNDGPLTGYVTLVTVTDAGDPLTVAEVLTDQCTKRTARVKGAPIGTFSSYAQLLLLRGASAVKGEDPVGGVPAVRISGRVQVAQVRLIEPDLYTKLQSLGVADFACDAWVDAQGRVIKLDQVIVSNGQTAHTTVNLTKFATPVKVAVPVD